MSRVVITLGYTQYTETGRPSADEYGKSNNVNGIKPA